jgi:hypothetical protein
MRSVSGPSGLPVIGKAKEASTVNARIEAQTHTVGDLDRRIGQIDMAIEEAAKRGRSKTASVASSDDDCFFWPSSPVRCGAAMRQL